MVWRPESAPPLRGALLAAAVLAWPALTSSASSAELRRGIERILARPGFTAAHWGIEVRSLRTGKVLYALNSNRNFKPASTLKLVTSAAALDAFGPEARIRTTLETAGRLDGMGRVLGDLYLVGRGDPDLSGGLGAGRAGALEELADALRVAGVRRVEGRLIGHAGLFPGEPRGADWSWEDLVWSYGAEISALSLNGNSAELVVLPGERVGDPLVVDRIPLSRYYRVVSSATTSPAGSEAELALSRAPGSNEIRLSGTLPAGAAPQTLSVALEAPALYAATVFAEVLELKGIRVEGVVGSSSDPLPPGLRAVASHDSEPLAEILKRVNKPSRNLHAELLLRLLGVRAAGVGSAAAGHAAVADFLRRLGVRAEGWALQDGSGLSRSDILSPSGLVDLLVGMNRHPHARAFRESLAIAAVDGTLQGRMTGTPAAGRILAKSGTLRHVNALAGYAEARKGERLAFAIVVNHHTLPAHEATAALDAICNLLVK